MKTIEIDLDQKTIGALASIKITEILKEYLPDIEDNIPDAGTISLKEYYERLGVSGDGDLSLEPYNLTNYAKEWE